MSHMHGLESVCGGPRSKYLITVTVGILARREGLWDLSDVFLVTSPVNVLHMQSRFYCQCKD